MKKLLGVEFHPGGPCPEGLPPEGGPLLPWVDFFFTEGHTVAYPASFFEDRENQLAATKEKNGKVSQKAGSD